MSFLRSAIVAARSTSGIRAFSTARVSHAELAYQVYGPEKEQTASDPVLFLHGLFGSKQNNRSISKYASQMFSLNLVDPDVFLEPWPAI